MSNGSEIASLTALAEKKHVRRASSPTAQKLLVNAHVKKKITGECQVWCKTVRDTVLTNE
jgi:hypothetical protein